MKDHGMLNRLYGHCATNNDPNLCMVFFRRRCKKFIPTTNDPSRCFCGRLESEHDNKNEHRPPSRIKLPNRALKSVSSKLLYTNPSHDQSEHDYERWNVAKHTTLYPTNAYGIIEFENMLHPAKAHYLRLAYDTNPGQIVHLFTKQWRLQLPNLIVSIHGGIQNFDLQPRLRQVLKRGLLKAAKTAGAWIFTSGINTGAVKHVGDALYMRSKIRSNIVVIGIAPWGIIQGREQLKGENQTVSYHSAAVVTEDNCATLNSSHSCFLLVDNGTIGKYGGEVILRKRFEKYLSQQKISFHGHVGKQNIPVVCVVVEGGTNTIRTVLEYVTEEPPVSVVVIDGSGRAADLIAFAYKHTTNDGTMAPDLQEQLLHSIEKVFNYTRQKAESVYVELIVCMRKRQYITIYRMDDDDSAEQEDVDQAILRTLLRNHKASALEQFRLTLSWNRPDIAQTCLLTKRPELTQAQLDVCMFEALVDNRVEYVKLLIENGVSIKNFLTFNRLQALYNACGANSTLHLIAKDVIRGVNYHAQPRIYSLYDIGLIVEKLIGQGYRSSYTRRTIRHLCARQPLIQRQNFNVYTDAEQKEQHLQINNTTVNEDVKRNSLNDDPTFDFPYNELLVFAVLTKRHEMALFFWAHGEEALAKALIGCRLNKSLAREAQDDELDTEIADEFLSNAEDFQQRALALLDQCYQEDDVNATQILTFELENWSNWTCLDLSVTAYLRDFVAHKCCQQLLSDLWIGGMNVRKYLKWMVLLALFFPPALFLIDFKSSKELQLMPQTEEEYFQNEDDSDDGEANDDDSTDNSSGDSRSSSSDESPELVISVNNTDRDDEQTNDEMQHETNALRKRRRKSRKKKRKKLNSSTAAHADDQPSSPILINNSNNNNNNLNRSDDPNLFAMGDLTPNHRPLSSSITGITTIPINEQDEIDNNSHDIVNERRSIRHCITNAQERIHHSFIYRVFDIILHRIQRFLHRYGCGKKTDHDHYLNDNAEQISLPKKIYEFYNAPVTKFFQDLIFFILFLAIFTYVVLIRTPPKPSVWEWILMVYLTTVAMDLIRELLILRVTRWKTWLSVYFHDVLHIYDTFCCLMFALAFGLRLTSAFLIVGRLLLCINLSLWYLRMFHFLVVSKEVGPYIHIAARNIIDLFRLIVIVLIVLMSFGVSRQAIKYPDAEWSWHSVKEIFLEPYFMIYGEVYADKIDATCNRTEDPTNPSCQFGHFITPITMTAFLLVCNILLLSMLMAQFTSTFMRLSRLSDQVWKFQRYHTILQYEQKPLLAPPLIIFSHIFLLFKTIYRICLHRKRTFNRGLKLFLSAKEIEKLRDFEEECVHEYILAKEDKEKSTVEERMSTTSERVSHMLTRVETLKRNSTQQANNFQNFDERLQRLEDMQATTLQLLNVLVQNTRASTTEQQTLEQSDSWKLSEKGIKEVDDDELFNFAALSSTDDITRPVSSLLSSSGARPMRSASFTGRKVTNSLPIPSSAPPQIIVGGYCGTSATSDERSGTGPTALSASSSVSALEDSSHLYQAEQTETNIYGKLIKERFRKLSEFVEDIERTLPNHQQRDKCDTTDDDETLSTMDWVDTNGRTTYNSTRVSRYDINQEDNGQNLLTTTIQNIEETEQILISDVSTHSSPDHNVTKQI
ncbi:unnamed protein product [Adineta steineri]|uniref:Transient receptor potential cation channel trpm n=1 Tax=Adineta steineri TaxID=433720 RepID=A0A814CF56_9BILA|nr:unnamed protein product [Adineta steineri]